jgi:hypothetical protein
MDEFPHGGFISEIFFPPAWREGDTGRTETAGSEGRRV